MRTKSVILSSILLAVIGLAGCEKGTEENGTLEGKSVQLKIELPTGTRTVGESIEDQQALTLTKFKVIFIATNGQITKVLDISSTTDIALLKGTGYLVKDLEDKTAAVEVIANTTFPAATPVSGNNWNNYIKEADFIQAGPLGSLGLTGQAGQGLSIAQIQSESTVNIYGKQTLTKVTDATESTNAQYKATVQIAPTVSRFEGSDIKVSGHVQSMDIEAMFIDRFYKRAYVTGVFNESFFKSPTADPAVYKWDGTSPDYPSYALGWTYERFAQDLPVTTAGVKATLAAMYPTLSSPVFGYYFFAAPYKDDFSFTTDGGSLMPKIVFKVNDVVLDINTYDVNDGTKDGILNNEGDAKLYADDKAKYEGKTLWATIGNYTYTKEGAATTINTVVSGFVFAGNVILLSEENLHPAPNSSLIDVTVNVTPIKWTKIDVTPVFE